MSVQLLRCVSRSDGVYGLLTAESFACFTVERPWIHNQPLVSCIPAGIYPLSLNHSPKFHRDLWEVMQVTGRDGIRIHPANRASELEGCIAPGDSLKQDATSWYVTNSRATLAAFMAALGDKTTETLVVIDLPGPQTDAHHTVGPE